MVKYGKLNIYIWMHIYVEFLTSIVYWKNNNTFLSFSSVLIKKASVYNIGNNFSLKF